MFGLTALMIFRHGGFAIGHKFAVATLIAIAIGTLAAATPLLRWLRASSPR